MKITSTGNEYETEMASKVFAFTIIFQPGRSWNKDREFKNQCGYEKVIHKGQIYDLKHMDWRDFVKAPGNKTRRT